MLWYVKAAIVGGIVLTIGGAWWYDRAQQYKAGYTSAELECEKASRESLEERISNEMAKLGEAIEKSRKEAQTARERASELSITLDGMRITLDDIKTYREVDDQDDCSRLGDMFLRLYNEPVERFDWGSEPRSDQ